MWTTHRGNLKVAACNNTEGTKVGRSQHACDGDGAYGQPARGIYGTGSGMSYTIRVTIGDATVEVSGDDREGLVQTVRDLKDVMGLGPRPMLTSGRTSEAASSDNSPSGGEAPSDQKDLPESKAPEVPSQEPLDAREFFKQKSPSTQVEAAAVATFYLTEDISDSPPVDEVGKEDIEEVFRLAGRKLPSRTQQLLVDAHKAGYLDRVATGRYRLTNVGYNLVAHSMGLAEASD